MGLPTAEKVAQRAFDLGLLDERQLREVWAELGSRNVGMDDFLQLLVRRELLTNYQVGRLVKGDRTGFFFGDYKVLYLVGTGTFARVYRAVHRDTGQVVAVKVLRNRYSDDPNQYGQFLREGKLGCALRHPNIVPIYEVISRKRVHFLTMEFIEGRNLREFVKVRGKIEPPVAIGLMRDITEGLRYACENGLTHRDLKMSNVLISSRGKAKLVDFGLATLDGGLSDDNVTELSNARTIDYAALERATGVRKDDTRSDIYFVGCMFYNMLTGEAPLTETRDRVQRLAKSRFLNVTPIHQADPTIPNSLALVVNKAMMLDPNRRYQTPAAMLADLHVAAKRLAEETASGSSGNSKQAGKEAAAVYISPGQRQSVMVIESNTRMQDVFREAFKRAGYRVLLTSDPSRAMTRFRQDAMAADCALFNAQELGHSALEMFNEFGTNSRTSFLPAILLLDENQQEWREQALTGDQRIVLTMPITMKQLRLTLAKLIPAKAP